MKLRRIITASVVVALLVTIFASTVFASTGESFSYPSGEGDEAQLSVSTADAQQGLIEPASTGSGNFNDGETFSFIAKPHAGYVFDRWQISGSEYLSGIDKDTEVLKITCAEGGLSADSSAKVSAVAYFKAAEEPSESPDASEAPEASGESGESPSVTEGGYTREEIDNALSELTGKYPTVAELVKAYPTLEALLADYPMLVSIIKEYPPKEEQKDEEPLEDELGPDPDGLGAPQYIGKAPKPRAPLGMTTFGLAASGRAPEWPEQGAVYVEKTAAGTGTQGKYNISLEVFGKNIESTSDIVLVLDDSRSMTSNGKLNEMKSAANSFVDGLIGEGNNIRIAIVSINGGGTGVPGVRANFTADATTLHNAINGINATGGTNLQGGFYLARQLMNTSNADKKSVVLMSDGDPTYSYEPVVTPPELIGEHQQTSYPYSWVGDWNPSQNAYNANFFHNPNGYNYSNVVGSGTSNTYNYAYSHTAKWSPSGREYSFSVSRTLQNSVATINEAGYMPGDVEIFTIGFDISSGSTAQTVLQSCATGGHYYGAVPGDLSGVFSEIGSQILYAAREVTVSDPMSIYVDLVISNPGNPTWALAGTPAAATADVVVTSGSVSFSYDDEIDKWSLSWSIPSIQEQYENDGVTPKGEKMTYKVTVDLDTTIPGHIYPSNKDTYVNYTDTKGEPAQKVAYESWAPGDFTIPAVSDGYGSIKIVYYRVNSSGQPVNSAGVVQPDISTAYIIDTFFYEVDDDPALIVPGNYTVVTRASAADSSGATYSAYIPGDSRNVSLTTSDPAQTVYFGFTKDVYTIRFDLDGKGTSGDQLEFTGLGFGDDFPDIPEVTANTGWIFTGWSPSLSTPPATVTGNATYTAQYNEQVYDITYDLQDGTVTPPNPSTYTITTPTFTLKNPTKKGYTFVGWTGTGYTEPTLNVTIPVGSIGDRQFTAHWELEEYTITYILDGGVVSEPNPVKYTVLTPDITLNNPAKTGFTFTGWTGTGLTEPTMQVTIPTGSTGNREYTATYTRNKYTIMFDLDGKGTTPDQMLFTDLYYGDPFPTAPVVTAYPGWIYTSWDKTLPSTVTESATYTAQYTQREYTVTFLPGDHGTLTGTSVFTNLHYGDTFPTAPTVTAHEGWTFNGWPVFPTTVTDNATYTAEYSPKTYTVRWVDHDNTLLETDTNVPYGTTPTYDGDEPTRAATAQYTYTFSGWSPAISPVTGDIIYKATYEQTLNAYTVRWVDHDNTPLETDTNVPYGTTPSYDGAEPTRAATAQYTYTFSGWSPAISPVTGDITYRAQYNETPIEYTVRFNLGDHGSSDDQTVFTGLKYGDTFPTAPAVTPDPGYVFNGWPTLPSVVTGNAVYTAEYTLMTFTVRFFEADGTTQIGTSQTVRWGGAAVRETAPAIAGRTFSGWRLSGDNPVVATSLDNVRENIDAVATYNAVRILVIFVDYNGDELGRDEVPYGGDATPPQDPEREGHKFTGWSPDYNNVTRPLTVVAQYQINTYTVTFVDYDGDVIDTQTVEWRNDATAPDDPAREGYEFTGWDVPFTNVTQDITVTAQYEPVPVVSPTPSTTVIPPENPPTGRGGNDWLWWLLLIPAALLIWLLTKLWFAVIPVAEAVTDNGNGTYTVQWGYENRKLRKYTVERDQSVLSVIMGKLIGSSDNPPTEFEKGRVKNAFTTIVDIDAEIQWRIKGRKERVNINKLEN